MESNLPKHWSSIASISKPSATIEKQVPSGTVMPIPPSVQVVDSWKTIAAAGSMAWPNGMHVAKKMARVDLYMMCCANNGGININTWLPDELGIASLI